MNTSKWIGLIILIIVIFIAIYISICQEKRSEPVTHNVEVVEDQHGIWRIKNNNGYDRGSMVVNREDMINWDSMNSDVQIAFPVNADEYFEFEQDVLDDSSMEVIERYGRSMLPLDEIFSETRSQLVERGGTLSLKVRKDAPADTIEYEVYVVINDTLVVGYSPPNLIIR